MIEDFITEFKSQLNTLNYLDIDNAEKLLRSKYKALVYAGISASNAIISLGDPVNTANQLYKAKAAQETNELNSVTLDQETTNDTPTSDTISENIVEDVIVLNEVVADEIIEDFIAEFKAQLNTLNYLDIDNAEKLLRSKYKALVNAGISASNAIISLGDPVNAANQLYKAKAAQAANELNSVTLDQESINDTPTSDTISENIIKDEIVSDETIKDTIIEDELAAEENESVPVNPDSPKTKFGVYMTDALFMTPGTLLCAGGTIAMTFISILSVVIGFMYSIKAWTEPLFESTSDRAIAFFIAIGVLIAGSLGIILTVLIIKAVRKGIVAYLADRRQVLSSLTAKQQKQNDKENQ